MAGMRTFLLFCAVIACTLKQGLSVECYQCSTDEDPEDKDLCGAYRYFDTDLHLPVDCYQDDSVTPGQFCVKITHQSPRMFIWDGRWRTVIRRCASVTDKGVLNVCNWGVDDNGVYWEECYCTSDGCNGSSSIVSSFIVICIASLVAFSLNNN